MWYSKTPQGFIRVYSDDTKPLLIKKEVSKYTLAERVVIYSKELKKRREQIIFLKEENVKLQAEIISLRRGQRIEHVADISLSSMVNEVRRRTDNTAKLALFKQIVDDNVQLRKDIKGS